MRRVLTAAGAVVFMLTTASAARAQSGQLQGFGGLTFGDVAASSTFGGSIAVPLGDHVQIVGEAGRMTDIMPSLFDTVLDFTPVDVRVSAWYGEAGVRVLGSSRHAVRPYVEGTAGIARLRTGFTGAGGADGAINAALGLLGSNEPLVGIGGGTMIQGGPLVIDLGYRYKRILPGSSLQSLLTGGETGISQVRLGIGVRF